VKRQVSQAVLTGNMGSLGQASNKLIRQWQFPDTYDDVVDEMHQADHDRMITWNYRETMDVFKRHMNTGDIGLAHWCNTVKPEKVLALLVDLFIVCQDDKNKSNFKAIKWTGFRITGTVNRSSGHPVYSLWLFAKGETSITMVYTGNDAPRDSGIAIW